MKNIMYIIVVIALLCFGTANANGNKVEYFIAKKLYLQKQFVKSYFLFNNIVINNYPYNKYVQKSKLYMILIKHRLGKLNSAKMELRNFIKLYENSKYIDYACYLYAVINYDMQKSVIEHIFPLDRFKRDQTYTQKSIRFLKKIISEKYQNKIDYEVSILEKEYKKHHLYVANYYLKKKLYVAVINRMNIENEIELITDMDYKRIYILIKSCNELFLENVSENILTKIENYDRIVM